MVVISCAGSQSSTCHKNLRAHLRTSSIKSIQLLSSHISACDRVVVMSKQKTDIGNFSIQFSKCFRVSSSVLGRLLKCHQVFWTFKVFAINNWRCGVWRILRSEIESLKPNVQTVFNKLPREVLTSLFVLARVITLCLVIRISEFNFFTDETVENPSIIITPGRVSL